MEINQPTPRVELMQEFKPGQIVRLENGYRPREGHLFGKCGRVIHTHCGLQPKPYKWAASVVFAEGEFLTLAANQCSLVREADERELMSLFGFAWVQEKNQNG